MRVNIRARHYRLLAARLLALAHDGERHATRPAPLSPPRGADGGGPSMPYSHREQASSNGARCRGFYRASTLISAAARYRVACGDVAADPDAGFIAGAGMAST